MAELDKSSKVWVIREKEVVTYFCAGHAGLPSSSSSSFSSDESDSRLKTGR